MGIENNRTPKRREKLMELAMGLLEGRSAIDYINQHQEPIQSVTPGDVIYIVDRMVNSPHEMPVVKKAVSKLLNVFFEPLNRQQWHYPSGSFLNYLILENQEIDLRMKNLKKLLKKLNVNGILKEEFDLIKKELSTILEDIADYKKHYIRKENILFPNIEKKLDDHNCLKVMWSIHDDFRESAKNLMVLLEENENKLDEVNREMGRLFFAVYPMIFREEKILFPVATELFTEQEMEKMHQESMDFGFAHIQVQSEHASEGSGGVGTPKLPQEGNILNQMDLGTGSLSLAQLSRTLNSLPFDMTFVDENDEVRYFSNPPDRIFPRSNSIIGRKVQNCHPPESMQMVEDILDSFKSGTKDKESFWINMKAKFILIQYFAVRDEQGHYLGTLEVSQDATWTRSLQGEKRLIDN